MEGPLEVIGLGFWVEEQRGQDGEESTGYLTFRMEKRKQKERGFSRPGIRSPRERAPHEALSISNSNEIFGGKVVSTLLGGSLRQLGVVTSEFLVGQQSILITYNLPQIP